MLIDVSKYDIRQLDELLDDIAKEKKKREATDLQITIEGMYDRRLVFIMSSLKGSDSFHITTINTLSGDRIQLAINREEIENLYKWLCRHFCCNLHM